MNIFCLPLGEFVCGKKCKLQQLLVEFKRNCTFCPQTCSSIIFILYPQTCSIIIFIIRMIPFITFIVERIVNEN
jgi:hypothetical protein